MGRKVPDASSSSRNDNSVFARVERGVTGSGLKAAAADGSSFFIPASLARESGLTPGQELDEAQYRELKSSCEFRQARAKALDLLAVRDHSAAELRLKLLRREFSRETIEQVTASLQERGLLDDLRYAEGWLRMRLRKNPSGQAVLSAELAARGVDRRTAELALEELLDEEVLQQALDAAADKLLRSRGMTREKMIRSLLRKGFSSPRVIAAAAARFPDSREADPID
jgi:SOS response regulatory protein OraA/RecX